MSEAKRQMLSELGKRRWASKSEEEKRRHVEQTKAAYRLKYPLWATWPERWMADVVNEHR